MSKETTDEQVVGGGSGHVWGGDGDQDVCSCGLGRRVHHSDRQWDSVPLGAGHPGRVLLSGVDQVIYRLVIKHPTGVLRLDYSSLSAAQQELSRFQRDHWEGWIQPIPQRKS